MKNTGILALALISFLSCNNSSADKENASTPSDSIPQNIEKPLQMLPDTVLPSVSKVNYEIQVTDSAVNPVIDDLHGLYNNTPGVFTFRKTAYRDADFNGRLKEAPTGFKVDWTFSTSCSKTWGGGSGWTGQPIIVSWPDSCLKRMANLGVGSAPVAKDEVMVGSLAGKVYFIDYKTGKPSRNAINVTNPIKGTMSLDPSLNGNLYVGQGVPDERPVCALVIDLYKNQITHKKPEDRWALRRWEAYDSSPVRVGQFLFRPGENGILYKYLIEPGNLKEVARMRYRVNGASPGMEASMSVYLNYGYVADNHGNILCVNLNTLKPVWHYSLGDDIDSTPVVEVEGGIPYVYTGCEVDKQGSGKAKFVKLNGLTGEKVWLTEIPAQRHNTEDGKHFDGGYYGTCLPGRGNCKDLVFANVVINENGQNGKFVAFKKATGEIAYTTKLRYYAWSSPVGFLGPDNEQYVVTGDCSGRLYLINGKNGNIIANQLVGSNFESSPAVIGNSFVVGSRGDKIFKVSLVHTDTAEHNQKTTIK